MLKKPFRRRVQLTVLIIRLCDEMLNRGDVDGVKAMNGIGVRLYTYSTCRSAGRRCAAEAKLC